MRRAIGVGWVIMYDGNGDGDGDDGPRFGGK
jgi:hypothetical protein